MAVGVLFAHLNIAFSTWILNIPYISEKLHISEGDIGLALFFLSLGAVTVLRPSSKIIQRFGEGRVAYFSSSVLGVFVALAVLAPTFYGLCCALFWAGMSAALLDISMNAMVATVEKQKDVRIMSTSHGFFSLGGMIGAGMGTLMLASGLGPEGYAITLALVLPLVQLVFRPYYFSLAYGEPSREEQDNFKANWALILLAAMGFMIMVGEGAVADWSALYMQKVVQADPLYWAWGFAGFSAAMAMGRFYGDGLSARTGSWPMIRGGAVLGALGLINVLFAQEWLSIFGFTLIGFGFSVIVPELYRIASRIPGLSPSQGLSFMAATGYVGFLIGPVFLGFVGELWGLQGSFGLLLGLLVLGLPFTFGGRGQKVRKAQVA